MSRLSEILLYLAGLVITGAAYFFGRRSAKAEAERDSYEQAKRQADDFINGVDRTLNKYRHLRDRLDRLPEKSLRDRHDS